VNNEYNNYQNVKTNVEGLEKNGYIY